MSDSLSGFDTFIRHFRAESNDPSLDYWADAIFVMLWQACPLIENRFRGGLAIWALSVIRLLVTAKSDRGQSGKTAMPPPPAAYGFRFLSTPAHHDTLAPLTRQLAPEQRVVYGYGIECAPGEPLPIAFDMGQNLATLGWRASLRVLRDTLETTRQIQRILSRIPGHADRLLPGFAPRLAELIFRQGLEYARLRRTPCPHRAVFLTYELIPEAKAWVRWARDAGARVIHVMHGQRLPTYQVTMATDLVLFSKVDENWFRERVDPQVKVWTIGHPRLEAIRAEVGLHEIKTSTRLPRIAFFSQPFEGDYSRDLRLRDWQILTGLKGRAEVRFRLHPREDREAAVRDLKKIGAEFIELSDAGLKEDLAWCDAVASSWSTVSMEAAACGRGVFWTCTTPEKYEASRELQAQGIGALIHHAGDWQQHLDAWHAGGWDSPVIVPDHQLQELGMTGDSDRPWTERLGIE